MISFFSKLFNKKEKLELSIDLEDSKSDSVTLVTKKVSGEGTFRVYINEWKYNLRGFKIEGQSKHTINASYLVDGTNTFRIVATCQNKGVKETYFKDFEYNKAS